MAEMLKATIDIGIVIVSWNSAHTLGACLESLEDGVAGLSHRIAVVDNASSDASVQTAALFPGVDILDNQVNLGFARACNQGTGLLADKCRYVLLLNPDTVVGAGALRILVEYMDAHPPVGACGPQLALPNGAPQPFAFGRDPSPGYLISRTFSRLLFKRTLHDWGGGKTEEVEWVSGACLMLRADVLEKVGTLDEACFMYFEDNDLCLRLRQAGWKVVRHPEATVTHIGGLSIANNRPAKSEYYRSLERFYAKHYGLLSRCFIKILLPVYQRLLAS
jgi:N-acetylglucosaminyl-diphospho-decaprenol L-rhamnosyltransferase